MNRQDHDKEEEKNEPSPQSEAFEPHCAPRRRTPRRLLTFVKISITDIVVLSREGRGGWRLIYRQLGLRSEFEIAPIASREAMHAIINARTVNKTKAAGN